MTHKEQLLSWFRRGLSITPAEAVNQWNNYRLADTVYQLRKDGHQINTQTMERTNEDGRRITWARYSYICGPKDEIHQAGDMPASDNAIPAERKSNGLRRLWAAIRGSDA